MLKKLRRKVILTTMISVIAVLAAIMIAVNVSNYARVSNDADMITETISRTGGNLGDRQDNEAPRERPEGPPDREDRDETIPPIPKDGRVFTEETPFDTRFFTVTVSGETLSANVDKIAAVTEEDAKTIAENVLQKGKERGYYDNYRYLVSVRNDETTVVFVDVTKQLTPLKSFLHISLIVSAASIVLIFLVILFSSKRMIRPIAESYEKQNRFVTDAGHELKTPLTVISANNDLIEMETGESESTAVIRKQVSKLTAMVNNFTALAKMNEAAAKNFSDVDFSTAVEESSSAFEGIYKRDHKVLRTVVQPNVTVHGDANLLNRLLGLVFENASKYSLTETSVSLSKAGGNAMLVVTNDADGVEKGNLDKCFERFYRSDEARGSRIDGSGIGLSVAKEIVLLHKGKITAEGKPGANGKMLFEIRIVL